MTAETILTNALLVLPRETMPGTLLLRDGCIAAIDAGRSDAPGAIDLAGDTLIPGAVDLHSDNLERQVHPRSTARWPSRRRARTAARRERTANQAASNSSSRMIGLLQSGTGTGNGIWRPSCVSGLLEELFADALRARARADAFAEDAVRAAAGEAAAVCTPVVAPGAPAAARPRVVGEAAWSAFAVLVCWAAPVRAPVATEALVAVPRAPVPVDAPAPAPVGDPPDPLEGGVLGVVVTGVLTVGTDGVVTVTGGSEGVVTGGVGACT